MCLRLEFTDVTLETLKSAYEYHKDKNLVSPEDLVCIEQLLDSESHACSLGMLGEEDDAGLIELKKMYDSFIDDVDLFVMVNNVSEPAGADLMLVAEFVRILTISSGSGPIDFARGIREAARATLQRACMLTMCVHMTVRLLVKEFGKLLSGDIVRERVAKTIQFHRIITKSEEYARLWREGLMDGDGDSQRSLNRISERAKEYYPSCIDTYQLMRFPHLHLRLQNLVAQNLEWLFTMPPETYEHEPGLILLSMAVGMSIYMINESVDMISVKMTLFDIGALNRDPNGYYAWNIANRKSFRIEDVFMKELEPHESNYATYVGLRYATMRTIKLRYPFICLDDQYPSIREENIKPLIDNLFAAVHE